MFAEDRYGEHLLGTKVLGKHHEQMRESLFSRNHVPAFVQGRTIKMNHSIVYRNPQNYGKKT